MACIPGSIEPSPAEVQTISDWCAQLAGAIRDYDRVLGGKPAWVLANLDSPQGGPWREWLNPEIAAAGIYADAAEADLSLQPWLRLLTAVDELLTAGEDAFGDNPIEGVEVDGWPDPDDVLDPLWRVYRSLLLPELERSLSPAIPQLLSAWRSGPRLYRWFLSDSDRSKPKQLIGWWYPLDDAERTAQRLQSTRWEPESSLDWDVARSEIAERPQSTAERLQALVRKVGDGGIGASSAGCELLLRIEARRSANAPPTDLTGGYRTKNVVLPAATFTWPALGSATDEGDKRSPPLPRLASVADDLQATAEADDSPAADFDDPAQLDLAAEFEAAAIDLANAVHRLGAMNAGLIGALQESVDRQERLQRLLQHGPNTATPPAAGTAATATAEAPPADSDLLDQVLEHLPRGNGQTITKFLWNQEGAVAWDDVVDACYPNGIKQDSLKQAFHRLNRELMHLSLHGLPGFSLDFSEARNRPVVQLIKGNRSR